jgi:hypothetical protein
MFFQKCRSYLRFVEFKKFKTTLEFLIGEVVDERQTT